MTNSIKTSLTHKPKKKKKKAAAGGRKICRQRVKPIVPRAGDLVLALLLKVPEQQWAGRTCEPSSI